jgi:hypothetical protein
MPLDDMDMARLRAEMLRRAEQPTYDDGASQLGQDPNMMRVGFFGRGPKPTAPVNPSRRSLFGLPEAPVAQPIVPVTPQQPAPTAPQPAVTPAAPQSAVAPAQPANPLGQLAQQALNAPVSRRQVLKRAGAAAIQSALPMPSATDVAKEVLSPLAEAAVAPAAAAAQGTSPAIAAAIRSMLKDQLEAVAEYGEEGIPETIESYLPQATTIDPNLKRSIDADLQRYRDLENADINTDASDDLQDAQYELSTYLDPIVDHMPVDNAWQELTGFQEFEDFMNEKGVMGLVKKFRQAGASKEDIIDFLDTNYPGFDEDDIRRIEQVFKSKSKTKRGK